MKMLKKLSMLIVIKKYEIKNNVSWNVNIFSKKKDILCIYDYIKNLT